MDRRSFIVSAGGAALAGLGSAGGFQRWQEITPGVRYPGRAEGHLLRDRAALPPPSHTIETDVAILGSGIAGLSAAWQLDQLGRRDYLLFDGPEAFGNAAGSTYGEYACPTGAHYLPLPGVESAHVRAMLADLGVIQDGAFDDAPRYDERFILHGPEDRLFHHGQWQDGLIPADDQVEQQRFLAHMDRLRHGRGADGRRSFVFPSALSSSDPVFDGLDALSFAAWLDREGYRSPALRWYLDYCCRDDYGAGIAAVSAWAGVHYFAGRLGRAANADDNGLLTWPGGLAPIAGALAERTGDRRRPGTTVSVRARGDRAEALCFALENGKSRSFLVKARRIVCAMPLFVAARVVEGIEALGFDPRRHLPAYAPWMVTNFVMRDFPREREGAPLAWDNVVYGGKGLGYVVSTHQDIRVTPPAKTVFTAYMALADRTPLEARRWLQRATPEELVELASSDLRQAYGWAFAACVERADITLRGHAMAIPAPGFRGNAGLAALREAKGPVLFAHSDLSGFSVFEEAAWWGCQAARRVGLAATPPTR
ncbi:NAD(P)/FAD-dependent oxidoreductase [Massilia sp. ST3]|uniref:NAD(P)-binding protein n=1 Tax=Massilia sp. ST3 TaxID=2824903 RepID=UPI001B83E473|nr:NAD(P)/FAD-dependent oxidoreductase [Massilia sp. ST3]MBQ5948680.1 NAD(P)-binding protein [Massilia sp. ST3]